MMYKHFAESRHTLLARKTYFQSSMCNALNGVLRDAGREQGGHPR